LAFENSEVPGWTTERIVDAFAAHTVPIYWGDPTVKNSSTPPRLSTAAIFLPTKACIEYILKVDADDEALPPLLAAPPFHQPPQQGVGPRTYWTSLSASSIDHPIRWRVAAGSGL